MTDNPTVGPAMDHRTAAAIVETALSRVFDARAVAALREDSPLTALAVQPADLVCIGDAVASAAGERAWSCVLSDADVDPLDTVSDLIAAVRATATRRDDQRVGGDAP
jgi:hypothetical protein